MLLPTVVCLMSFSQPDLDQLTKDVVETVVAEHENVELDKVAFTINIHDRERKSFVSGSYRGDEKIYPASVVKVFFLAYGYHLIEQGRLEESAELLRGFDDMIRYSSNDATNFVLEVITDTDSGPELDEKELAAFIRKREQVNRWFKSMGYRNVYAAQKTWYDGPYGRDRQAYGPKWERRNMLTTNNCALLLSEIMMDVIVSPESCEKMRALLSRANPKDDGDVEDRFQGFIDAQIPAGAKLWSKAGWTSTTKHDVACVRFADGREVVLSIFTEYGAHPTLVKEIAKEAIDRLTKNAAS